MNHGRMLLTRGDPRDRERAQALLRKAAALANEHGGGGISRDAEARLGDALAV